MLVIFSVTFGCSVSNAFFRAGRKVSSPSKIQRFSVTGPLGAVPAGSSPLPVHALATKASTAAIAPTRPRLIVPTPLTARAYPECLSVGQIDLVSPTLNRSSRSCQATLLPPIRTHSAQFG